MSEYTRLTAAALIEELKKCPPHALVEVDCGLRNAWIVSCISIEDDDDATALCEIYDIDAWLDEYGDTAESEA